MHGRSSNTRAGKPSQWHALHALQDQVNQALNLFYDRIGTHHHSVSGQVATSYEPPADIHESENALVLTVELPGMNDEDVEVLVTGNRLTVQGEKVTETRKEARDYLYRERFFGRVRRTFQLPESFCPEEATATFRDGLLRISVPGKAGVKRRARRIRIGRGS